MWQDAKNGRWRVKTLEYQERGNGSAFVGLWEYNTGSGKWSTLDKTRTECGCGDCPCAETLNKWVQPKPRMALRDLLDKMLVAQHLEIAQPGEEWQEGKRDFISMFWPDTRFEFELVRGDSYHAMAPFVLHLGGGQNGQTIYTKGGRCGDQLAFQEEEGFLLLTAEYTGGCARLVNLRSGHVVANLPDTALNAVWTNRPQ